ncbi:Protein kinase domain-containing protein [Chitinophaga rupis]|uniref:Protein kinase domain-containing protein n=1 Tax=Chitinophaga rupis TaxID=573321 RepID=A0A1H7RP35_9BACT|nr:lanthionine synthetase LanC family protein [Chitinophaga rupis]SEL61953.1 Protein kinase domain-containing protein [Chitinophaga rupis]
METFKKLLNKRYHLRSIVKKDVFKGVYRDRFLRPRQCIVKAEKVVSSRLKWQAHVHKVYAAQEYMPKCVDYFYEEGCCYLVLECIKGISLAAYLQKVNFRNESWYELNPAVKKDLIHILLNIISITGRFHRKGYIHRSICTSNIFIDRRKRVYFINAGMAWPNVSKRPDPPFGGGMPGFIPPEQYALLTPTEKEDVYGLGALMITLFTGLDPAKFTHHYTIHLAQDLCFLTGSKPIADLIVQCLDDVPARRPSLEAISAVIENYQAEMERSGYTIYSFQCTNEYRDQLSAVLDRASKGVVSSLYALQCEQANANSLGLSDGIAGVLYLLARLRKNNIDVTGSITPYYSALASVKEGASCNDPGLWKGAAGVALAFSEGIKGGLIPDTHENRDYILRALDLSSTSPDMNSGAAGQGIALNLCCNYLDKGTFAQLLKNKVRFIVMLQQKEGYWQPDISFAAGTTGITWFLLDYVEKYGDDKAAQAALRSLHWISRQTNDLRDLCRKKRFTGVVQYDKKTVDEVSGCILTFIKAYEVFKMPRFKKAAEYALSSYPKLILNDNYTQSGGLAGLGELYLEAFRVFKTNEWKLRANWIANILLHSRHFTEGGYCYWIANENTLPAAALTTGNGGIIHFLLRCLYPEQTGYRILQ